MAQNDKKLCLLHSMSQEVYIIWLWFLVHMCKMMTSPDGFFIFSKYWFFGLLRGWEGGGLKGKKWPKLKNNDYIPHTPYLRSSIAYDLDFWYTCIKWWRKKFCLSRFIFQEPYIIWLSFMVDIWKMVMSLAFFFHFFKILIFRVVLG